MPAFTFAPLCTPGSPYSKEYAASVVLGEPLPLFSMLMPAGWEHAPTQLKRSLYTGSELGGIPDVALVYLVPTPNNGMPNIAFVRSERAEALGATVADFERVALHNVSRRPASWNIADLAPGVRIAMCEDDYLAAERILDTAFMTEAAAKLDAPGATLLVGIPTRGVLVASVYTQSEQDGLIAKMMQHMFREARNKPICPWPFLMQDGRITAALEVS